MLHKINLNLYHLVKRHLLSIQLYNNIKSLTCLSINNLNLMKGVYKQTGNLEKIVTRDD